MINKRKVYFAFDELFNFHTLGVLAPSNQIEPVRHWETPEGKRRIYSLLKVSGLFNQLQSIDFGSASLEQIEKVHTKEHINHVLKVSETGGELGDMSSIHKNGHEIALRAAGGVIECVRNTIIDNCPSYALVRPAGHHAGKNFSMGFCVFNNVAIGVEYALSILDKGSKVAIVDFDVHHGNGTQDIYYDREEVLFISVHQNNNYPNNSGYTSEKGNYDNILNIPLKPGSGSKVYRETFENIIIPRLQEFKPDIVFVSAGYDASYLDPLGRMMCSSDDYAYFSVLLSKFADEYCNGRLVCAHEGGYSEIYVPICASRFIEGLIYKTTEPKFIQDPFLNEVKIWNETN